MEQPRRHHRQDEVTLAAALGSHQCLHAQAFDGPQDGFDVPMRQRAQNLESVVKPNETFSLERALEGGDDLSGPIREVGEGAFADLGTVAVGLPQ
jgi:hypothetical protein